MKNTKNDCTVLRYIWFWALIVLSSSTLNIELGITEASYYPSAHSGIVRMYCIVLACSRYVLASNEWGESSIGIENNSSSASSRSRSIPLFSSSALMASDQGWGFRMPLSIWKNSYCNIWMDIYEGQSSFFGYSSMYIVLLLHLNSY